MNAASLLIISGAADAHEVTPTQGPPTTASTTTTSTTMTTSTTAAGQRPERFGDLQGTPNRFVNFVYALHDGAAGMDGVDDFLTTDRSGLVIEGGTQYDGLPVMRPTTSTIDGLPIEGMNTVIALANQSTASHNGIWEMFTDTLGIEGTYLVRTRIWNSSMSNDPESFLYAQAATPFVVSGGSRYGRTFWMTSGNGLEVNVLPMRPAQRGTAVWQLDIAGLLAGVAGGVIAANAQRFVRRSRLRHESGRTGDGA